MLLSVAYSVLCERSLVVWQVLNCTLHIWRSCLTLCTQKYTFVINVTTDKNILNLINLVCSKWCTFGISAWKEIKCPLSPLIDIFWGPLRLSIENTILAMFNGCAIKFPNTRLTEINSRFETKKRHWLTVWYHMYVYKILYNLSS